MKTPLKFGPSSLVAVVALWSAIVIIEHYVLPVPWTWQKVWLQPVGKGTVEDEVLVLTRADILSGSDVLVCKTGAWLREVWWAEAIQNFIPLDDKWQEMNSAWKAGGVHRVRVPAKAVSMNDCRPSPIRLDTSLGVGRWGLRIETRIYSRASPIWPTTAVAVARFEVRE